MGIPLLDISFILAALIEILIPIILAIIIWKKFKVSWSVFFLGMLFFIVSLIRIPLNNLFTQFITSSTTIPNTIIYTFAFSSLTAALFEEGFRVLGIGAIIKPKSYYKGLMYGAGHGGGGEAMIFIGLTTLANYIIFRFFPGILPSFSIEQFTNMEWYMPLVGALERIFAITIQVALSVLVMHAFLSRKYIFIFIAIIYHLVVDFVILYLNYIYGFIIAEAAGLGFALIGLLLIFLLKPKYKPMHKKITPSDHQP